MRGAACYDPAMRETNATALQAPGAAAPRPLLVVCLEEEVRSPVSHIRLVHHLQDLKPAYRIAAYELPRERDAALEAIPHASLLVMARNRHVSSLEAARRAGACGVPLLCDIDDYVWEFPDYSKIVRHATVHTDEILRLAACVTTPSEALAALVRERHPGKDVRILPNAGDIWSGAGTRFTPCVMANSDFFRMPEMKADFFRAVRDAAAAAESPVLLYYFSNDPPEPFSDDPWLRIIWMGFRSYSSYKELLDAIRPDFGFVLLRDEPFSRFKSVVKFAEYGAGGTIGLFSRVPPYAGFIEEGVNGFLADNTYAGWREAVLRVLRLEPAARARLRVRIAADVERQFAYGPLHSRFRELADGLRRPVCGGADRVPDNLPPRQPFAFREAYAYASWVLHAERPRLERELALFRRSPVCRLLQRLHAGLRGLLERARARGRKA